MANNYEKYQMIKLNKEPVILGYQVPSQFSLTIPLIDI